MSMRPRGPKSSQTVFFGVLEGINRVIITAFVFIFRTRYQGVASPILFLALKHIGIDKLTSCGRKNLASSFKQSPYSIR